MGVHSGAGATTLVLALANYLSGFLDKKVAVYEFNNKNDFSKIYDCIFPNNKHDKAGSFIYKKITYYMKGSTTIQRLLNDNFDIVIVDFGSGALVPDEFLRCHNKIVISSMEPWFCRRYEEFCERLCDYRGSDLWLHIIGSDTDDIKRIKRDYKVMAVERPNINNAYVIDKNLINFFQSLFL